MYLYFVRVLLLLVALMLESVMLGYLQVLSVATYFQLGLYSMVQY